MRNLTTFLVLTTLFISCGRSISTRDITKLEILLDSMAINSIRNADKQMWALEFHLTLDERKVRPLYNKGIQVSQTSNHFYNLADSFLNGSSLPVNFETVKSTWLNTLDTFEYYMPVWKYTPSPTIESYNQILDISDERLTVLAMKSLVATNEAKVLGSLYRSIESYDHGWLLVDVNTGFNSVDKEKYSFNLKSQSTYFFPIRTITIDTITRQGKAFEAKAYVQDDSTFATVTIDSLAAGSYVVRGTVKAFPSANRKPILFPFEHRFIK